MSEFNHENPQVVRKGSWFYNLVLKRSEFQLRYYPDYWSYFVGFNVVTTKRTRGHE